MGKQLRRGKIIGSKMMRRGRNAEYAELASQARVKMDAPSCEVASRKDVAEKELETDEIEPRSTQQAKPQPNSECESNRRDAKNAEKKRWPKMCAGCEDFEG